MTEMDIDDLNAHLAQFLLPNTIILFVYLIVGILGNITVVLIYTIKIKANKDDRFFIPYLAITDGISCIVGSTFAISLNLLPIKFTGDVTCKFLWFLTMWSTLIAALMLVIIAVQRFLKVCRPFGAQMTSKKKHFALGMVFFISIVSSWPTVLFHGQIEVFNKQTNLTGFRCGRYHTDDLNHHLSVFNIILLVMASVGISVVALLYLNVGRSIYRQTKFRQRIRSSAAVSKAEKTKIENSSPDSGVVSDGNHQQYDVFDDVTHKTGDTIQNARKDSKDSVYSEDITEVDNKKSRKDSHDSEDRRDSTDELHLKRRKTSIFQIATKGFDFKTCVRRNKYSILFMVITLVFVVSYAPRMVIMVLEARDVDFWDNLPDQYIRLCLFFYRFYIINNITNPFLYAAFDVRFRQEIRKLCKSEKH